LENTENTPPAPTRLTDDETDVRLDAVRDLPFFQTKRSVVIRPVLKACAFDVEHTGRAINVLENIGCMDISAACEITANLNSLGDGESFKLLLNSVEGFPNEKANSRSRRVERLQHARRQNVWCERVG